MAGENVTERDRATVFSQALDVIVHVDRDDASAWRRVGAPAGDGDHGGAAEPRRRADVRADLRARRTGPAARVDRRAAAGARGAARPRAAARAGACERCSTGRSGSRESCSPRSRSERAARWSRRRCSERCRAPRRDRRRRVASRAPESTADLWLQQAGAGMGLAPVLGRKRIRGSLRASLLVAALTGSVFVAVVPGGRGRAHPARVLRPAPPRSAARRCNSRGPTGCVISSRRSRPGNSLTQAVTSLAETGPLAMRVAFARFPQLARVLGTGPALELMKEDLADPTSDRVLEVLILAQERGGAIVRDILDDLVDATTKRSQAARRARDRGPRDAHQRARPSSCCRGWFSSR